MPSAAPLTALVEQVCEQVAVTAYKKVNRVVPVAYAAPVEYAAPAAVAPAPQAVAPAPQTAPSPQG